MQAERFHSISRLYPGLRIAVVGDFCLDRYFEIDPARSEISIETGLPVHNITRVRCQPGAAGTILNNLVALGIGEIYPVGFAGVDGEGFELCRALGRLPQLVLDYFVQTPDRRTFTYTKPLLMVPEKPPVELNRLDIKNWDPTPPRLQERLRDAVLAVAEKVDAIILMDQVDQPETGVVTARVLDGIGELTEVRPEILILADSRRSLKGFPPVAYKMNADELAGLAGLDHTPDPDAVAPIAIRLARHQGQPVFVTLAEQGILGAAPDGDCYREPSLPVRGPIDIVGAGDAVTANLAAALAAHASVAEAVEIANAAASIVIHQLGTTGTASIPEIQRLVAPSSSADV